MSTTTLRNAIHADIASSIRRALTPSLPLAEKALEERRWGLYNNALACRALADSHKAAGEIGAAAEYVARGRAILRELRAMEATR
jgi:hypothetical protein